MKKLSEIQKAAKAAGLGDVTAKLVTDGRSPKGAPVKRVQLLFGIPAADPKAKAPAAPVDFVTVALGCLDSKDVLLAHRAQLYPADKVRVLLKTDSLPSEKDAPASTPKS